MSLFVMSPVVANERDDEIRVLVEIKNEMQKTNKHLAALSLNFAAKDLVYSDETEMLKAVNKNVIVIGKLMIVFVGVFLLWSAALIYFVWRCYKRGFVL